MKKTIIRLFLDLFDPLSENNNVSIIDGILNVGDLKGFTIGAILDEELYYWGKRMYNHYN